MIGLRISKQDFEGIKDLLEPGKYKSVSELCRTAIVEFIANQKQTVRRKSEETAFYSRLLDKTPETEP